MIRSLAKTCNIKASTPVVSSLGAMSRHFSSQNSQGTQTTGTSHQQTPPAPGMVSFGFETVAEDIKQKLVNGVFSNVASKYDLMNDLMSCGVHRLWKDEFVRQIDPPVVYPATPGVDPSQVRFHMVDVAGGTGDISFRVVDKVKQKMSTYSPAHLAPRITVCDINEEMLKVGQKRAADIGVSDSLEWCVANGEALPFEDNSVDLITIAFGIRNFTHIDKGLAEAFRVLKPGGRLLILEFSKVTTPGVAQFYDAYSFHVIPTMGGLVANDKASYQYLVESIRKFPSQEDFSQMFWNAGFRHIKYTNMTFGVVAIHSGFKI